MVSERRGLGSGFTKQMTIMCEKDDGVQEGSRFSSKTTEKIVKLSQKAELRKRNRHFC